MKAIHSPPAAFDFYLADLDTLLRVESSAAAVVIRASRDAVPARRRASFVRELIAEGFIPEDCIWYSAGWPPSGPELRWLVDRSWLTLPHAALAETRRFMFRLLGGAFLLWIMLLFGLLRR